MNKVEELALKLIIPKQVDDIDELCRFFYIKGYQQAEKDLELTWEKMRELNIIFAEVDTEIELGKTDITAGTIGYYQEVLKRFKERKENAKVNV